MTRIALFATTTLLAAGSAAAQTAAPVEEGAENRPDIAPAFPAQTEAPAVETGVELETTEVAGPLEHPWGIAVLPGNEGYLVTERPGRLVHVTGSGEVSDPIAGVPDVVAEEQGGLLDVALSPDFAETRVIFLTYAKPMTDNLSATAAARAVLSEDMRALTEVEDIFVRSPGSPTPMHYGSRVVLDGAVPEGNPFAGEPGAQTGIWTLGHRNIQGAAIRPETGELWAIEHGPAGGDELNLIEAGANYGWPVVSYGINYDGTEVGDGLYRHEENGFEEPVYYWDPVIAPGGMTFYEGAMFEDWQGDLLIGGLVSGGLVRLVMEGERVAGEERLLSDLGRVRDVAVDRDGSVLVLTDFDDGALWRIMPAGPATD